MMRFWKITVFHAHALADILVIDVKFHRLLMLAIQLIHAKMVEPVALRFF